MGYGLVTGITERSQVVVTRNYNVIANSHTPQFTTARTKSSESAVFTSRCLVTACKGGSSRTVPVPQLAASKSNSS
jgi:hypothetical protein